MRGLIGALLVAPALAKSVESWDRVVRATDPSVAHIAVSVLDESHDDWEPKFLGFKLEVLKSDNVCGFGNITLDGQVLPQTLLKGVSSGKGSVTTDRKTVVAASWDFHCVNVNGIPDSQLLKFAISVIDGQAVKDTGFSALFRQTGIPEIINIETDLSIPDEILANPNPEELEPLHSAKDKPEYNVEEELAELDYLWAQMRELKHLIHEKERAIAHHTHQHFEEMEEDLAECDSLKCIAKTIAKEAKHAAHRLYGKISGDEEFDTFGKPPFKKPHFPKFPHHRTKNSTGFPKHPKGNHTHPHFPPHLPFCRYPPPPPHHGKRPPPPPPHHGDGPPPPPHHGERPPPPPPPPGRHDHGPEFDGPHDDGPHDRMPPPPEFDGPEDGPEFDRPPRRPHHESTDFDAFEKHHDDKPHHGHEDGPHDGPPGFDRPPPKHDGPHDGPPDFDGPPPHGPPHDGPPPHGHPHDGPPPGNRHDGPGPRHGPPHFALQVVKYTSIGFLFAILFLTIRRRACTPARRADRQARREERHRRRAYRRAAHKHMITRILNRISGDGSDEEYDDYEEKCGALLASAEDGLSTTMSEEITQLRNGAEVVSEMVVAEEERAVESAPTPLAVEQITIPVSLTEARPLPGNFEMAMLAQLGGEDLPAYEDNDGSEEGSFIADGFRYTPGSSNYSPTHSSAGSVSDILGPDTKS